MEKKYKVYLLSNLSPDAAWAAVSSAADPVGASGEERSRGERQERGGGVEEGAAGAGGGEEETGETGEKFNKNKNFKSQVKVHCADCFIYQDLKRLHPGGVRGV